MAAQQPKRVETLLLDSGGAYFDEQTCAVLLAWIAQDDAALARQQHHHVQGISQVRSLLNQLSNLIEHYNA